MGLAAAVLAAAGCRLAASLDDFWLDEIWSWEMATQVQSAWQILAKIHHDNNHFLNTWIIFSVGVDSHWFFYRLPAVVAGTGTVVLCGVTARRWGRVAALSAVVLTGASFPMIQYSSEARGYAYVLLLAVAAFEVLQRSFDTPRWWLDVLFACCAMLGFLAHLTFVYAYAALVAWSLWRLVSTPAAWSARHRGALLWHILLPTTMLGWLYFVDLRFQVVGGGEEMPWGTVATQALSLALGGPASGPWAIVVAVTVLAAAGTALHQQWRTGSDLWLPLGGCVFVAPTLVLLATRPTVVYPRYFLVSMLFLQLLVSWWLARVYPSGRWGKVVYGALLAAVVVGNGAEVAQLLAHGRGGYQAAVRFMLDHSSDRDLTVGSDHDFRNSLVLHYHVLRSGSKRSLVYYARGTWPPAGPEWVLMHSQQADFAPRQQWTDGSGNSYRLQAVFPYAGLSGWHWAVYRNGNRGGSRRSDAASARQ